MNILGHNIQFEHPEFIHFWWLGILVTVIACAIGYLNLLALRNAYSNADNLDRTTRPMSLLSAVIKSIVYGLAALLLTAALAEPFEANQSVTIRSGSVHLVAAFDVSPSIAAEDYRDGLKTPPLPDGTHPPPVGPWGSRLHAAKWTFIFQTLKAMPGNQVALGTYTADPWPQSPLSEDYSTLRFMLTDSGWMGIGSAPGGGSDFVQGLQLAIQTLREDYDPSMRQIIVLFSDGGVSFDSEEEKQKWQTEYENTVKEFKALNAELIVVGLGSKRPQLIPVYHPETNKRMGWFPLDAPDNKKEKSAVDEESLKRLVDRCGGKYVYLDPESDLNLAIDWVNTIGGTKTTLGKQYLTHLPLYAAMILFSAMMLRSLFRARGDAVPPRPMRGPTN